MFWLTLLFVALKLTEVITWSWFWVVSPTLIPLIAIGFITIFAFIATSIKE